MTKLRSLTTALLLGATVLVIAGCGGSSSNNEPNAQGWDAGIWDQSEWD